MTKKTPKDNFITRLKLRLNTFLHQRPLISFFGVLAVLLLVIIIGNFLRKPKTTSNITEQIPKPITVFSIGSNPKLTMSATIEKSGIIHVVAQSGGVVQAIKTQEGSSVTRGQWLFSLSTNYQGGNIASLNRQLAEKNYNAANDNFDTQLDTINKQRDLADKMQGQASALRDIAAQSASNTQNLVNLDQDLVNTLDTQLQQLEASPGAQPTDPLIVQVKQAKAGVLTGLVSLQTALSNEQYQADSSKEPAGIANEQHDLTREQLDLQERSLRLNKEIALLNLQIAQVSESLMYPASPVTGVVERIYVHVGQSVAPGTLLATITANKTTATAVIRVSRDMAERISRLEKSTITVAGQTYDLSPRYISTEPTDGTLYTALYDLPDQILSAVGDQSILAINVPVEEKQTIASDPFVPIDAIYQTETQAFLYVASSSAEGKLTAQSRVVTIGDILGAYAQVLTGLQSSDQVILNRNVIAGDRVAIQ